ncbi:ABC-2 type transport system permease protein [Paenibacillus turicensis]|uniref:ABC-2 type transport system permease protein n=1 Tax=Paenibacillus turicensis TaxID=160487 RepID=A0ABS4FQM0_9BACL|nr:ABC-2 family transporter protein [Paenibacillus turicensis]MBP1904872.1 ABC-2 type transport system permease protein [Paenibacillus turicensis]
MHYARLYLEYIKLRIMGVAENRKAFIMGGLAQFASYGAEFLIVWLLIEKFQTINGWGAYEVLLLFSLNLCSYAIAGFFFFNATTQLSNMVKNGSFDEVLTKPLNSFLYLVCREFNSAYITHFILSIGVIVICFNNLNQTLTGGDICFLIVIIVSGALIQAAGLIVTSVPSFWIVETEGLREVLFFQIKDFIRYPITIYNKTIQIILTFILPYAFINFYPVQHFLSKKDFIFFNHSFQYLSPIVGIVCFFLAYKFWFVGVNHYKSTGS